MLKKNMRIKKIKKNIGMHTRTHARMRDEKMEI